MIYEFDNCILDAATQQFRRDGEVVHVEPQVLAVLEYLAANSERVVSKIELLDEVWGDRFVSESALTSRIKLARKACGDSGREQRVVKTVHSRGYRMVAGVRLVDDEVADPGPGPAPAPRSDDVPSVSSGFVGRDEELAVLDAAVADAVAGRRRAVFVCGGIGAGKSSLLAEFLERQDRPEALSIAAGRCVRTRGVVEPYFALFDALGRLALEDEDLVRDTLWQVAPSWVAQMPSLLDEEMTDRLERRLLGSTPMRMLREGADAVEALARQRPLVLVIDDLQWADDQTLDVIDLLVGRATPQPLLLLGSARPDVARITEFIGSSVAAGRADELELGPLDHAAIARLLCDRFPGVDPGAAQPDEIVDVLARRSAGVPLFAEEILASWVRHGRVEVSPESGVVVSTCPVEELADTVPTSLNPLIERELSTLADDELTVLEAAATVGAAFDAAAVGAAVERPVGEVESALERLARRRGFIGASGVARWPDGTVAASYDFAHTLYRDILYDRISPSRRSVLHQRIGSALEIGHEGHREELAATLATHFLAATDVERAATYLQLAGDQAASRNGHDQAATFLGEALELVEQIDPGEARDVLERRIRMSLGSTLVATRGWFDASVADNYERVLELCAHDEHCPDAHAARYCLATVSELRGTFERTESLLSPILEAESPGHLALEAHELVACSLFHQGAFDRSLDNATMVLESWDEDAYSVLMARIAEHPASSCNSWASLDSWALGRSDESLRQAQRAVELGERNLYALSTAVQQRAMLHQVRNEPDECIEWADRCREVGQEQNFPMRTVQADIYKGWALSASGRTDEGIELIRDGLERFRREGATLNEAYYLGMYADSLLRAGAADDALTHLDEALERMASTTRTYFFGSELLRLRAAGLRQCGADPAEVRAVLEQSLSVARDQASPALELRTLIDLVEADPGDASASAALSAVLDIYADQVPTPDVLRARALVA